MYLPDYFHCSIDKHKCQEFYHILRDFLRLTGRKTGVIMEVA